MYILFLVLLSNNQSHKNNPLHKLHYQYYYKFQNNIFHQLPTFLYQFDITHVPKSLVQMYFSLQYNKVCSLLQLKIEYSLFQVLALLRLHKFPPNHTLETIEHKKNRSTHLLLHLLLIL